MDIKDKNILVISPHTDDGELGCGGTIARLIEEKNNVYYVCFSICEESVPKGFPKNALEIEIRNSMKKMKIKEDRLILNYYPVRKLNEFRQEILEKLIKIKKTINPNIIFMPSSFSLHQDHKVIYEEGIRAFKHFTCFGYDLPWDTIKFTTTSFFKLEKRHLEKKSECLKCYKTQVDRIYCNKEFVFSLAKVRGSQISVDYAEAFEMIRVIF